MLLAHSIWYLVYEHVFVICEPRIRIYFISKFIACFVLRILSNDETIWLYVPLFGDNYSDFFQKLLRFSKIFKDDIYWILLLSKYKFDENWVVFSGFACLRCSLISLIRLNFANKSTCYDIWMLSLVFLERSLANMIIFHPLIFANYYVFYSL